jgi:hypothetical protein
MQGTYINSTVWNYLEGEETKVAKRILKALNYDIAQFVRYDDTIHIERTWSGAVIPNYLFNYIQSHQNRIIAFGLGVIN